MAQSPQTTPHDLTVAEIVRLTRGYQDQRRVAVQELIAHEQRRAAGVPEPAPLTDIEKLARARALQIINGAGSAVMFLPPPASRLQMLQVEIRGLDLCLDALTAKETAARATEALAWKQQHLPEWTKLAREILLTATRLAGLECKAATMKADRGYGYSLPLDEFIGGRSVVNVPWQSDPLATAIRRALAEKIISAKDLEAAKNV